MFLPPPNDPNNALLNPQRRRTRSALWAAGYEQNDSSFGRTALFGGGIAGLTAIGFVPYRGTRLWDRALSGIRALEDASPMRVFRTFQWSELLSPLQSSLNKFTSDPNLFFTSATNKFGLPEHFANQQSRELVANMLGKSMYEVEQLGVFEKGLQFERTGVLFGRMSVPGGPVLSEAALPFDLRKGSFVDWYARASGAELPESIKFGKDRFLIPLTVPKVDKVLGVPINEVAALHLQRARLVARLGRAYAAAQIGRLNRLLEAPAEIFPSFSKAVEAVGLKKFSVKQGTASSMLAGYIGRGLLISGIATYAGYLSYLRSQESDRLTSGIHFGLAGAAMGAILGTKFGMTGRGAAIGAGIGTTVGLAPRFDRGIGTGLLSMYTDVSIGAARVSEVFGRQESIAEQEALMPGVTKLSTALGFVGTGMTTGLIAGYAARLNKMRSLGIQGTLDFLKNEELVSQAAVSKIALKNQGIVSKLTKAFAEKTGYGLSYESRLMTRGGWIGSIIGAGLYGAAAMTAALATGNLVPGILGSEKTPEELEAIYSGQQAVPIRKGRWWESGSSPFSGGKIMYYRPHAIPLAISGAKKIGQYGSEEEYWRANPLLNPLEALFSEEFKYRWERQNYEDRPYPLSMPYGSNIPFITPIAEAWGTLIKRPVLMHSKEWLNAGSLEQAQTGEGAFYFPATQNELTPAAELGGLPPQTPTTGLATDQRIGDLIYRINELRGLPGFVHGAVKERLTGSEKYFGDTTRLATPTEALGITKQYWDLELGGLAGFSEAIRRYIPRSRGDVQQYNPIANNMPSYIPGSDYMIDFRTGDPYAKISGGEYRLPGAGYAALNPQVKGLAPEDYPLFHRYKILADIAPYSNQFAEYKRKMQTALKQGQLSGYEAAQFQIINEQVSEKKKRNRFQEYRFADQELEKQRIVIKNVLPNGLIETEGGGYVGLGGIEIRGEKGTETYRRKQALVSDYLREYLEPGLEMDIFVHRDPLHRYKKTTTGGWYAPAVVGNTQANLIDAGLAQPVSDQQDPYGNYIKFGAAQRTIGGIWERMIHSESPIEALTPLAPQAKFIHARTALEEYERSRIYGREIALWQKPIEHFIKPFIWRTRRQVFGSEEIPENVQQRWSVEQYFDRLKWLKAKVLEQAAIDEGNQDAAKAYKQQQRETLFGLNPYGNPVNILRALPGQEKDYFQAFSEAQGEEERQRILSLQAPDYVPIYQAQWDKLRQRQLEAEISMGENDKSDIAQLESLKMKQLAEGREITPETVEDYQQTAQTGESYAEWSRRKEIEDYFSEMPLPAPDWVGWHPSCDLEDVKMATVQNMGSDYHDYNLWDNRKRELAKKPYINQESPFENTPGYTPSQNIVSALEKTLRERYKIQNLQIKLLPGGNNSDVQVELKDNRKRILQKYKQDPEFQGMM